MDDDMEAVADTLSPPRGWSRSNQWRGQSQERFSLSDLSSSAGDLGHKVMTGLEKSIGGDVHALGRLNGIPLGIIGRMGGAQGLGATCPMSLQRSVPPF